MATATRGLWLAFSVLLAIIVGIVCGGLSRLGGDGVSHAIMAGGAAFGATVTLAMVVLSFVASADRAETRGRRRRRRRRR